MNGLLCVVLAGALLAAGCSVPPPEISCESPADDSGIAIIGDSVFDLAKVNCTHVGRRLEEMTGSAFVDESVSGATLGAVPQAPGGSIVTQYAESVAPAGPRAVVLDGGANDLFWNCPWHQRPGCATAIDDLETQLRSLITDMRTDGVDDIVYVGMYHFASNSIFAWLAAPADPWSVRAAAVTGEMGVTFVDPRAAFDENPGFLSPDGVHPSASGSAVLAELIHGALVDGGVLP